MSIKPIGKRVFIKLDQPDTTTPGGIILTQPKPVTTGVVAFVGSKVEDPALVPGARVHLGTNFPQEEEVEGEKYIIMMEEAIKSVI